MRWPDGPWVKDRQPGWYALPENETKLAQVFISQAYGERHIAGFCHTPVVADKRLYFLDPVGLTQAELAAILNSSVTALLMELAGRVTLGDGALELTVADARDYLRVPDVREFNGVRRQAIVAAFRPLLDRPIGSVFEEVQRPDRQAFDAAVLQAMGLDPGLWLPRLYHGLATLVRERTQLGQMRGQVRRSRRRRAAKRVNEEVLQDLLPDGPARFPDGFLSSAARAGAFREIPLPPAPLRRVGPHFGQEQLATREGATLLVANKFEARYVLFAQAAGHKVARLPERPVEISRTVNYYLQYLRDLRRRLRDAYFTRTLDQAAADRFAKDVWRRFGLPPLEQ